jgi:hypothetical protein
MHMLQGRRSLDVKGCVEAARKIKGARKVHNFDDLIKDDAQKTYRAKYKQLVQRHHEGDLAGTQHLSRHRHERDQLLDADGKHLNAVAIHFGKMF